ncbi:MAG: ABC transporter permease subunit [Acidobacteria bacterium]|nr:ABC transporter permease subunit [Acidobacteriota bacterium]
MATNELLTSQPINLAALIKPSGWQRIRAIAVNTFRESVRDRVLYNLILFVLLLVGASVFISELSVDQEAKFIADLGLSAMVVFGALIAIFIGVGLVFKEIDKRTIYTLLSKPVKRHEFIIGKYLGLCLTLLVNSVVMVVGTELALLYVNGSLTPLSLAILPAAYLIFLELMLIVAMALMFSSFSTPLLSALLSFAFYIIGHFSNDLKLAAQLTQSVVTRTVLTALYYVLPNLSNFSFITPASHNVIAPANVMLGATIYALVYISILLAAAILIFQKRNFK